MTRRYVGDRLLDFRRFLRARNHYTYTVHMRFSRHWRRRENPKARNRDTWELVLREKSEREKDDKHVAKDHGAAAAARWTRTGRHFLRFQRTPNKHGLPRLQCDACTRAISHVIPDVSWPSTTERVSASLEKAPGRSFGIRGIVYVQTCTSYAPAVDTCTPSDVWTIASCLFFRLFFRGVRDAWYCVPAPI